MAGTAIPSRPERASASPADGGAAGHHGRAEGPGARLQRWWLGRLPATDSLRLTQGNLYILPTRAGLALGLTLLVLLVAAINFQLNLGYALTFLLAGCALTGMYAGHATLRGLTLHLLPPAPVHAGSAARLDIRLDNPRAAPRHAVALGLHHQPRTGRDRAALVPLDVPAQGSVAAQAAFVPARRGLQPLPALTAETRFPIGTFRVWCVWRPAARLLVYPAPEADPPPLPSGAPVSGRPAARAQARGTAEFDGMRPYQRGDSQRIVLWKQAARAIARGSDDLMSRDTHQLQQTELWLLHADAAAAGADTEARLSRLCAWVLQADRLGIAYGLELPGARIAPATGDAHRRACLEALALC
jgi:uncharacterized protein (DUF58 family)